MDKKFILIFFLLFSLFLTLSSKALGVPPPPLPTQTPTSLPPSTDIEPPLVPQPGVNCGVASQTGLNICCSTSKILEWELEKPDLGIIEKIPLLGHLAKAAIDGIIEVVNAGVDELPFPIVGHFLPLPTVGKIKSAIREIPPCVEGNPAVDPATGACVCSLGEGESLYKLEKLCENLSKEQERESCRQCLNDLGIWTSLGCVKTSLSAFINETVLGIGIGIAGMITFLCIIYSAFVMQTSAGDPERLKKARQNLTSCIVGLLFIIFAVFILRLIGIEILKIPGFEP